MKEEDEYGHYKAKVASLHIRTSSLLAVPVNDTTLQKVIIVTVSHWAYDMQM